MCHVCTPLQCVSIQSRSNPLSDYKCHCLGMHHVTCYTVHYNAQMLYPKEQCSGRNTDGCVDWCRCSSGTQMWMKNLKPQFPHCGRDNKPMFMLHSVLNVVTVASPTMFGKRTRCPLVTKVYTHCISLLNSIQNASQRTINGNVRSWLWCTCYPCRKVVLVFLSSLPFWSALHGTKKKTCCTLHSESRDSTLNITVVH